MKLKTNLNIAKYSPRVEKNFPIGGVQGCTGLPIVNLGPPKISKITTARILQLKTQLDIVKYLLYVKKIAPIGGVKGAYGP